MKKNLEATLIERFNKRHAVIDVSGSFRILTELKDPVTGFPKVNFSSLQDMKYFHRNQMISRVDGSGNEKLINPVDVWLSSKDQRSFKRALFTRGMAPKGITTFGAVFMWKLKKAIARYILHTLKKIFATGIGNYLIGFWIGWRMQFKNRRQDPGTAIVLRGKQGTGKGVFLSSLESCSVLISFM